MDAALATAEISLAVSGATFYRQYKNDTSLARPMRLDFSTDDQGVKFAEIVIRNRSKVECKVDTIWLVWGKHPWTGLGRFKRFKGSLVDVEPPIATVDQSVATVQGENPDDRILTVPPEDRVLVKVPWESIQHRLAKVIPAGGDVALRPLIKFRNQRYRRALRTRKVNLPT